VLAHHGVLQAILMKLYHPRIEKGGSKVSASMTRFKHYIDGCELLDLPLNGKRFT